MTIRYCHFIKRCFPIVLALFFISNEFIYGQDTDKMMIIIIDGARYSETFGDPDHTYIPEMWELAQQGTIIDNFYNDNYTYTSRAIPALWCGAWTDVHDTVYQGFSTQYSVLPSIFEYYRKQKNMPAEECFYILKYIQSLWLPSFDPDYGPEYWPEFHSYGSTDNDVAMQTEYIMDTYHPHFLWVYLADVDHAGHSGNWTEYTNAIQNADQIVGELWNKIQSDPFYANSTTLFVTNDHGRHDDQHGGFQNHGCGCEGCRHIEFLAVGPDIKKDFVSSQYRYTPDMAVTASYLLGIEPEKATGNVIHEIIDINAVPENPHTIIQNVEVYPNPFRQSTKIVYQLSSSEHVLFTIFDFTGKKVINLVNEFQTAGMKEIDWDGTDNNGVFLESGIYTVILRVDNTIIYDKLLKIK